MSKTMRSLSSSSSMMIDSSSSIPTLSLSSLKAIKTPVSFDDQNNHHHYHHYNSCPTNSHSNNDNHYHYHRHQHHNNRRSFKSTTQSSSTLSLSLLKYHHKNSCLKHSTNLYSSDNNNIIEHHHHRYSNKLFSSSSSNSVKTKHYHRYSSSSSTTIKMTSLFWRWTMTFIMAFVLSHNGGRALSFPYDDTEIIGTLTGVAGGKIALPCNISTSTPKDSVSLILWYKDESTTPIYSVDARKGVSLEAARRVTDENLASRAYMNTGTNTGQTSSSSSPYAHLMLELLTPDDAGEYACRVDFRKERTRNSVIFLKIIVPPEKPQIIDTNGESLPSLIGPYTEGDHLTLICEVEGGKPQPSLTWWRESVLLDDTYEQITTTNNNQLIRNQLIIQSLRRQDLMAVFTCQASNNNISLPSTATVTVDLNFRPLTVKIIGERKQSLSAEKISIITCESSGSRPPATITWWIGGTTRLRNAQEQISADGNKTTSRLSLTVTIDDIGKEITCRAENPHIQSSAIEDLIQLEINYAPQVTLKLGSNLRHSHIQEGNDVYFECVIRASPWSYEVRWHFEGRELQTNTSAGIIVSNQSLVLQKVRRQQRGKYTCSATNSEGDGESNAVHLRIQFAPICKAGQKIIYGAARHETVNIVCELESDPSEVEFFWSYNGTGSEPRRETATLKYESTGPQSSLGRYTPHTEFDYGTIYCWGRNSVGIQSKPCAYSIVAAGSPDPVRNCSVFNVTEDSMRVDCDEGYDGGLIQHFLLEIYDTTERNSALRANVTASTPQFYLNNLQSAHTYLFVIYAANAKGRSKGIALTAFTLAMPESMNRLAKGNVWQLNFNPVLVVLIAVVTGIVLIAFFIVLIVRWKTMKPPPNVSGSNGTSPTSSNANHRYHRDQKSSIDQNSHNNNNNNNNGTSSINGSSQTTTNTTINSTTLLSSSDMSSSTTTTSNNNHNNHNNQNNNIFEMANEMTTKNALCTDDLDDLVLNGDDLDKQLTIPLNGHHNHNHNNSSSPSSSVTATSTGANFIRSNNIYSAGPLLSTTNNNNVNGMMINNKHVTWRPETPPSPNIYTQYTNIGYMPITPIDSIDSYQLISSTIGTSNNSNTHIPMSYTLSGLNNNNSGGGGDCYETTFMDQQPNHNYNHHSVPQQQQQHSPYGVIVSDNNVVGVGNTMTNIPMSSSSYLSQQQQQQHNQLLSSSLQNNNPYGIHTSTTATAIVTPQQQQQQSCHVYGTIPRRVRVIPNNNNNNNGGGGVCMGITTPLGIIPGIPGSSSIASSSSNGTTNSSSLGTTNHSQTTQSSSSSLLLHPTAINVGGGGNQYQFHHPSTTTNHNGLNINQQQQQQQQTPTSSSSSTTTNISDQSSAMTQV
ncbi:uncharacterized protein LOC113789318 isoform X3 [Dermatophagoides pteronyssinus]|uniref:uncharacterized protein LOC113789318 isoform X3 n=1 Tax=Dermatophagoides pteronyssinus TaxID=6956 RepID=UPI003F67F7ED